MGIAIVSIECIPWREAQPEGGLKGACLTQEEEGIGGPVPGVWVWKALLTLSVPPRAALHSSGGHSEILPLPKLDAPSLLPHGSCLMHLLREAPSPRQVRLACSPPHPHFGGLADNLPIKGVKESM